MSRRFHFFVVVSLCLSLVVLAFPITSKADIPVSPHDADSAYDLINSVNGLRVSYGVPAYSISTILMSTAQAQADFMATNGTVTHYGPGGIGVTERLLAAGYPLAGDLSLGGFRSENIIGGIESMSAQTAVEQWTGDSPHLTTMISPDLTEIGAGVAVVDGRVYYVIDCARPTAAGASQSLVTPIGGGTAIPAGEATVQPVQRLMVSTPDSDGNVVHEVQYGQSLWQIAIAYGTKIDEIKWLNHLSGNDIYPGDKLLIKSGVLAVEASTETLAPQSTMTSTATISVNAPTVTVQPTVTTTQTPAGVVASSQSSMTIGVVVGIIVLALLGGGLVTWSGRKKSDEE